MKAKWIWAHKKEHVYNETIIAQTSINLNQVDSAKVKITADSYYRLFINKKWINDGPCRSWPEHFQYDEIDVGFYLQKGRNEIKIVARHYGIGDFHGVYKRPGLLMEMKVKLKSGKTKTLITDKNWKTGIAKDRIQETAKIAIQMEPSEKVDARLQGKIRFCPATEICSAHEGPWKNLIPRDVTLLSRKPFGFKRFMGSVQLTV